MKFWLGVSLFLSLILLAPSHAELTKIQINSEPQGAVLTDQFGNNIGLAGTPLFVDLEPYGSNLEVTLSLEGYESKLERIKVRQLKESKVFPKEGAIALRATSNWVALRTALKTHPQLAIGVLLFSVAGLGFGLRKRSRTQAQLARAQTLEAVQAHAEEMGDTLLGSVIGGYRLVEHLGEGGTARVYRALPDESLNEDEAVAVKVLHPESEQDEDFRQRFQREVTIWKSLSHPNIVSFIDWGEQEGLTYMVMELIDGGTLRSKFDAEGMPPKQALALMTPVFEAVTHAHSQGVVHRDLKPENVMITNNGRLKVADFGLARSGSEDRLTKTGTWLGTPRYIAPEQIRGLELDPQTDQYALGIMMYELLSGDTPFVGDQVNVIFQQVSSKPVPLRQHRPDISEALSAAVDRMLAKEPAQRFPDLAQARAALEASHGQS